MAEGQTDLLFHPGLLSGTLNRDSSYSARGSAAGTVSPVGGLSRSDGRMLMNAAKKTQNRAFYIYIRGIRHIWERCLSRRRTV